MGAWSFSGDLLAAALVVVVALSLGAAPHPDELRSDAVLHLVGARRRSIYGVLFWKASLAIVPGAAIGIVAWGVLWGVTSLRPNGAYLLYVGLFGILITLVAGRQRVRASAGLSPLAATKPAFWFLRTVRPALGALVLALSALTPARQNRVGS